MSDKDSAVQYSNASPRAFFTIVNPPTEPCRR